MKHITLAILSIFLVLFTGCQFSENIYMNADGTGKMEFSMDASELMLMAGDEMSKENNGKAMDSTIVFKDFLEEKKDSIATLPQEDQAKLKALEDFKMHIMMDPETKKMVFDLSTDFKYARDLQDMFKAMNSMSNFQGQGGTDPNDASNPFASMGSHGSTQVSYTYDNNTFKRIGKIIDKEQHQQTMDSLNSMAMMFGGSNYKLNYIFPKPVKSVSNENAMLSQDRKTVTLEVGFMESLKDPELLNIEVILED
ncbi:MAG TPA: hypothetical protein VKZ98_00990 [Aquaticitalea sp.]|nr:hypothetical protein [Aquaticitalea sp.]